MDASQRLPSHRITLRALADFIVGLVLRSVIIPCFDCQIPRHRCRVFSGCNPLSSPRLPIVVAHMLHPSHRHIDGCINFHFTAPLRPKGALVECLCVTQAWSIFLFFFFLLLLTNRTKKGTEVRLKFVRGDCFP